ncbi:MAG: DUF1559 domain-containing protein [Planctomycetes bacterium]|nr:DUF1559 domain-containing protein [Planctomycetota bacterium]
MQLTVREGIAKIDSAHDGIFGPFSRVKIVEVTDGTSNTYLCGDKAMTPEHYQDGEDLGDDLCAYVGHADDITRFAEDASGYAGKGPEHGVVGPPVFDADLYKVAWAGVAQFGGCHVGGSNMCFCDGSVRTISYWMDPKVHAKLCNRKDGQAIDPSSLNP